MNAVRRSVSDAVARPVRTVSQGGAGWVITELIDSFLWNMNDRQYGILVIALTGVIGWAQVVIENHYGKAVLRTVPPAKSKVISK
jgi:hypothetical protein